MSNWNRTPYIDEEGKLHYGQYWDTGGMIILREALGAEHPQHLYNYLRSAGITPEDFGIEHPATEAAMRDFQHMSKNELIQLCYNQQKELDAMYRIGF